MGDNMSYTEIKYVDASIGIDTITSGSSFKPYETIEYCISQLTTQNPLVYIGNGVYTLTYLLNLGISNKNVTYIGNGINTTIEVRNGDGRILNNEFHIYSCIITLSEIVTSNYLVYSGAVNNSNNYGSTSHFYNVCFLQRNGFPEIYFKKSTMWNAGFVGKFYNCIFIGGTPADTTIKLENCAISASSSSGNKINLLTNCLFNEDYFITDETGIGVDTNNSNGVYSGEYAWTAFLLRQNGKYYSIYDSLYNSEKSEYEPLTKPDFKYKFNASKLFKDTTINGETFKPIDKFDGFSLILPVLRANSVAILNGIKSNKELIVQTFDVNVTLIKNINNLNLNVSNVKSSIVKLVCSKDMGESWFTIIDDEIVITDCIIPKKRYEDFTNDDLIRFNSAKETISEIGFSQEVLSSFDFNRTDIERLRFAYVLSTDDYDSNPNIEGLTINFDEKGYLKEMKDAECDIEVFEHMVRVTSKINSPRIETSIII